MSKTEAVNVLTKWFASVRPPIDPQANHYPSYRQVADSLDERGYSLRMLKPITDSKSISSFRSDGIRSTWNSTTYFHYETIKEERVAFSRISRIEIWASPKVVNQNGIPTYSIHLNSDSGPIDQVQDVINNPISAIDVISALLTLCPNVE